ncbi:MAG: aminotransferase class III-fold pyridoxal phosphate-dependent enzyme, partial [Candidatus Bathyarchaeia archaeon]
DNLFCHGQSYSGHALACAAALASIKVLLEENILNHVKTMGNYLSKRLKELESHKSVGDIRGLGLFWQLELVKDRKTKEPFRSPTKKYEETIINKIAKYLFEEKNVYIPADKFGIWIVPPLIVNKEEIDFFVDAIDDALKISDKEAT